MVFEDGMQRRDFVHVRDVARACRLALEAPGADGQVMNIGSGVSRTVYEIGRALAAAVGRADLVPHCTGKYRAGDIRHCFADISHARLLLGYEPSVKFEEGLAELAEWLSTQIAVDQVDQATEELARRGLVA
jgi:dTDP-L-rhamnose 4-epimerase